MCCFSLCPPSLLSSRIDCQKKQLYMQRALTHALPNPCLNLTRQGIRGSLKAATAPALVAIPAASVFRFPGLFGFGLFSLGFVSGHASSHTTHPIPRSSVLLCLVIRPSSTPQTPSLAPSSVPLKPPTSHSGPRPQKTSHTQSISPSPNPLTPTPSPRPRRPPPAGSGGARARA